MKNLMTLLALFLTNFVFSQEKENSTYKQLPRSEVSTKEINKPVFFINGKEATSEEVKKLKQEDIERMQVTKNDPKFPNGLVTIDLKK